MLKQDWAVGGRLSFFVWSVVWHCSAGAALGQGFSCQDMKRIKGVEKTKDMFSLRKIAAASKCGFLVPFFSQ